MTGVGDGDGGVEILRCAQDDRRTFIDDGKKRRAERGRGVLTGLAVGFAAVEDAADFEGVGVGGDEEEAVVADAEAEFVAALERFYVAGAGFGEAVQGGKDVHGGGFIEAADAGPGGIGREFVSERLGEAVNFFGGEAEFGEELVVRSGLVVLGPFAGFGEGFFAFRGEEFVVEGSGGDGAGDGVEHGFEQTDGGGKLCWRKAVDKFMGVVLGVGHGFSFGSIFTQNVEWGGEIVIGVDFLQRRGGMGGGRAKWTVKVPVMVKLRSFAALRMTIQKQRRADVVARR